MNWYREWVAVGQTHVTSFRTMVDRKRAVDTFVSHEIWSQYVETMLMGLVSEVVLKASRLLSFIMFSTAACCLYCLGHRVK